MIYSLGVIIGSGIGELHNPKEFCWADILETILLTIILIEFIIHTAFDVRKIKNVWHIADMFMIALMIIMFVIDVCVHDPDASAVLKI